MKVIKILIQLIIFCLLTSYPLTEFAQESSQFKEADLIGNYKIEKENLSGRGRFSVLNKYVFWDTTDFSKERLLDLIQKLNKDTENSQKISITIFTSLEELKKEIIAETLPMPDFNDTPEGRKRRKEFYEKYFPPETGYFRAFYGRNNVEETLFYSPSKDEEKLLFISLKN